MTAIISTFNSSSVGYIKKNLTKFTIQGTKVNKPKSTVKM